MAKERKLESTVADDKMYEVKLARTVKYAGQWLRADQNHWMLGRAINELQADEGNTGALLVGAEVEKPAPLARMARPAKPAS